MKTMNTARRESYPGRHGARDGAACEGAAGARRDISQIRDYSRVTKRTLTPDKPPVIAHYYRINKHRVD